MKTVEAVGLYRDDPPEHDIEPQQPEPPPLLAPLSSMDQGHVGSADHCMGSRDIKFDPHFVQQRNNSIDLSGMCQFFEI